MVKDMWSSLKENIKDRVTNPFLGTFVIVWIAHNWEVVYSFFYFDKEWKLAAKIKYFNDYWVGKSFFWNLVCVAVITLGILVVTYLFLAISRYMANLFENVIVPNIQRISKGKIVTAEVHQAAMERISFLEEKIEIERKAKIGIIQERDELEKRLYPKEEEAESERLSNDFRRVIEKALLTFRKPDLDKTILSISKSSPFGKDVPIIDFLLKNGIIELERKSSSGTSTSYYYKFTSLGNEFKKEYFNLE